MSLLLALLSAGILLGAYTANKSAAVYLCVIYLLFLGDIRRIWSWIYGFPDNDPLVVVGSLFALFVTVPLFFRLRVSDTVSKLCLGLLVVMTLQIFNPAQGGLLVGFTGMIYMMTPVLWFWIGRTYGSDSDAAHRLPEDPAARGPHRLGIWLLPDDRGSASLAGCVAEARRCNGIRGPASQQLDPRHWIFSQQLGVREYAWHGHSCGPGWIHRWPAHHAPAAVAILLPSLFLGGSRGTFIRVLFSGAMAFSFTGQKKGPLHRQVCYRDCVFGACGLALVLVRLRQRVPRPASRRRPQRLPLRTSGRRLV